LNYGFNRSESKWEDSVWRLTPVEIHDTPLGSIYLKREDKFFLGGEMLSNGSKARQGVYLASMYANKPEIHTIISGMAKNSPSHFHVPSIARHFGKKSVEVIGQCRLDSRFLEETEMCAAANYLGASFLRAPCNYNAVIQKTALEYSRKDPGVYYLEYGITLDHKKHPSEEIFFFHRVGANQVNNIPSHIKKLVIALGSGNSATSVLLGIAMFRDKLPNLRSIELIGTGPDHLYYVKERLNTMSEVSGVDTDIFKWEYASLEPRILQGGGLLDFSGKILTRFHDCSGSFGLYNYDMKIPNKIGNVELHPRYEGKMWDYIKRSHPSWVNEDTLFWVVGSELKLDKLKQAVDGYEGNPQEVFI